ncbi:MAG TPA: PAS domain S-box protein [Steroidobacteraceae bacterium]|jgi:PAS domain S-box-containing protein
MTLKAWFQNERDFAPSYAALICSVALAFFLYHLLRLDEHGLIQGIVDQRAQRLTSLLADDTHGKLNALRRMGERWDAANGTPEVLWRADARNTAAQMEGLRALEWVDESYHVRWVEPTAGNEKTVGLNVLYDEERQQLLEGAVGRSEVTLTPPLELAQGYTALLGYMPVRRTGIFDGFLVAVFSVDGMFNRILKADGADDFDVSLTHGDHPLLRRQKKAAELDPSFLSKTPVRIYDQVWTLNLVPSRLYIQQHRTRLPLVSLVGGLLVSLLIFMLFRAVLLVRRRSVGLSEANELNAAIMSSAANLIVATDIDGRVVSFNRAAEAALGYAANEVIGRHTPTLWHDAYEVEQRAKALAAKLNREVKPGFGVVTLPLESAASYSSDWTFVRKDGSRFPATLTASALRNQQGTVTGYLGVIEDITARQQAQQERRKAEEQLRISEERHRLLINGVADYAIYWLDVDGNVSSWNTGARILKQYADEEIIGKHYSTFFTEEDRAAGVPQQAMRDAARHGRYAGQGWRVRKDGTRFWANVLLEPIRNDHGAIVGFAKISHDETARRAYEDALKTSEETFRSAMEAASIGMTLVLPNGRFMKVNEALCTLLGYGEEELLALDFQTITHPDDLENYLDLLRQTLAGTLKHYRMEQRYLHRSGRVIWVLLSVSLVRSGEGEPSFFVLQVQDISEQKEVDRIKGEFISVVSHELRTPLTSIRGSLGLIVGAMAGGLPDKVKSLLDVAYKNCERLIVLINDILDMDKIAAGKMRLNVKELNLKHLVGQTVLAMEAYAEKFGVAIDLSPIDPRLMVRVDEDRLVQALSNLLSNAAKFSNRNGPIRVNTEVGESRVRILVADQGSGIPDEFRGRIFEKFSQADSSTTRRAGGTGLGLHITRQIVESMGGSIGYESTTGVGTTFWVEFPFQMDESARTVTEASLEKARPSILHIEDDADLGKVVATSLDEFADVSQATNLSQAQRLLEQRRFSLVILDICLPDGSGLDLLQRLMASEVPVIILCADAPPAEVHHQVDSVIVKTRQPEGSIVSTVLEVLKKRRAAAG